MQIQEAEYRCPNESYSINRAIHLGRMAAFDARCRHCPHRHDTGSLPLLLVEELRASWEERPSIHFDDRGANGILGEGLDAAMARRLAVAFGARLQATVANPSIVVTGDGRSATAELVAAASDGLRWSGCSVIEAPSATSACLRFTQSRLKADGALLVGNPSGEPRAAGMRFFGPRAEPLSEQNLAELRRRFDSTPNRSSRRYGGWRRGSAEAEYLATLAGFFHAIRPLKFVLDTSCAPLMRYLSRLLTSVACRVYSPKQAKGAMHFAVWINGDGDRCRVSDEQGREIEPHQLDSLLVEPPRHDALHVLALLLTTLSQSDRPLSELVQHPCEGGPRGVVAAASSAYDNLKSAGVCIQPMGQLRRCPS